jgi:hypothetical protein
MKRWIIILLIIGLVLLVSCKKKVCEKDIDCKAKPHFTVACVDYNCSYYPKPNECGNLKCETGENRCTCPDDCGPCEGPYKGSTKLVMACETGTNECKTDVSPERQKPKLISQEVTQAGDRFRVTAELKDPANLRKDTAKITIALIQTSTSNSLHKIKRISLTGELAKQPVTILEKTLERNIWTAGTEYSLQTDIPYLFHGKPNEDGDFNKLTILVDYEYTQTTGTQTALKTTTLKIPIKDIIITWAEPTAKPPCPNCDDNNPATSDACGPETNYLCQNTPIPNTCGNFACETGETKCTCAKDCGPCAGSTKFLTYSCKESKCAPSIKTEITVNPQSKFDPRNTGTFTLHMTYKYNDPFSIATDTLTIDTQLYDLKEGISELSIDIIKIMDGTQELATSTTRTQFGKPGESPKKISMKIQNIARDEEEHPITLTYYYSYKKGDKEEKGSWSYSLGKVTLLKT